MNRRSSLAKMNSTIEQSEESKSIDIFSKAIMGVILLCVYSTGVYLHVKIIQVSKKEKELTWKMDITNSIILMIHFFNCIFMHTLTYSIPNLHVLTGKWFCYVAKCLNVIGAAHTTGHSMLISLIKYVVIVHYQSNIPSTKKEKVKTIFFWINAFYPFLVFAICNMIRPDFIFIYDGVSSANRCLGKSEILSSLDKNASAIKLHHICNIQAPNDIISFEYFVYIVRTSICWIHVVLIYGNVWNLVEIIVYANIFRFMRR